MPETTSHIVFPIFNRMTHLDFTGPHQVFSYVPEARITVASMGGHDIEARGFAFSGLADLREVENCDVLCVPGGSGTTEAMLDEAFMDEIRRLARSARYLTSVCTGALILGAAGLLRGKRATTHWATRDLLESLGATSDEARVVRHGNVITAAGSPLESISPWWLLPRSSAAMLPNPSSFAWNMLPPRRSGLAVRTSRRRSWWRRRARTLKPRWTRTVGPSSRSFTSSRHREPGSCHDVGVSTPRNARHLTRDTAL